MNKIYEILFGWMGVDGMAHCLLSATITALLSCFFPWWCAVICSILIGIGKELYDKYSGNGNAEMKDLSCDIIGIIIGVL